MDDIFCLLEHLVFRNPKGCSSDRDGKIIDFNAIKLADGNPNGLCKFAFQTHLPFDVSGLGKDNAVFQPPKGKIGFC